MAGRLGQQAAERKGREPLKRRCLLGDLGCLLNGFQGTRHNWDKACRFRLEMSQQEPCEVDFKGSIPQGFKTHIPSVKSCGEED